jgi:hypothetical protein
MRPQLGLIAQFKNKNATGAGSAVDISGYKDVTVQISSSGNANATLKFAVSMSQTAPDFGAAQSATNVYDYIDLTPLNSQTSTIVGSTGISFSGTDKFLICQVDTNFVKWICPVITACSAGDITVEINGPNDTSKG